MALRNGGRESRPDFGAFLNESGVTCFRVWAPKASTVELELLLPAQGVRAIPMRRDAELTARGYQHCYFLELDQNCDGALYRFCLDSNFPAPDPCSRFQPEGVQGYSEIRHYGSFAWSDGDWRGIRQSLPLIYELHVGTFSRAGTFEGVRQKLSYLASLGIDAIELMPLAEFSGTHNWGYDGVLPFAPSSRYGRPEELQRLVHEAHAHGLGVILDVVYNHIGPEGAPQQMFADYLSPAYATPWGDGFNFEEPVVRDYVIENLRYWFEEFRIDGFRFDAIDRIVDSAATHVLAEVTEELRAVARSQGREVLLIAEDAEHRRRCLDEVEQDGFGFDLIWNNHFHLSTHAYFSDERQWYYRDFGAFEDVASTMRDGVVPRHADLFSTKEHDELLGVSSSRFVIFSQNHDVVGNRPDGARTAMLYGEQNAKLVSGMLLLQPSAVLLFMGEEQFSRNPFYFFHDMHDPQLRESIRRGRAREMKHAGWVVAGPPPESSKTFERSNLADDFEKDHAGFHRALIACRNTLRDRDILQTFSLRHSDAER